MRVDIEVWVAPIRDADMPAMLADIRHGLMMHAHTVTTTVKPDVPGPFPYHIIWRMSPKPPPPNSHIHFHRDIFRNRRPQDEERYQQMLYNIVGAIVAGHQLRAPDDAIEVHGHVKAETPAIPATSEHWRRTDT